MNSVSIFSKNLTCLSRIAALSATLVLAACNSEPLPSENAGKQPSGDFALQAPTSKLKLVEGDTDGLRIPLSLVRNNDYANSVQLTLSGVSDADEAQVTSSFSKTSLSVNNDNSELVLVLAIDDLPIMPQERSFILKASDGTDQHELLITVDVTPVDAPDIYLLVGQSNMVGFSGDGTKQAYPGGADETNPRIKQLNVSSNNSQDVFVTQSDFVSAKSNVIAPTITIAEDPLHIPRDTNNDSGKDLAYIGLGMSFAKAALKNTSSDIILVPAAWSGSSFCADSSSNGQWNALPSDDPNLGNNWLFERAITRTNLAIEQTGGILRGILWHQGESDSSEACAESYEQNLDLLVSQMRIRINADRRGTDLRRADSSIPFVAGTMSLGSDERGDLSAYTPSKQQVDLAHRDLPNRLAYTGLSNHDDLTPAMGYPCGNTTCIHFGAEALREMGVRYYDALLRAARSS